MSYFTEKELFSHNQHFAFKLRKMYKDDFSLFKQVMNYMPFYIQTNNSNSLDITLANSYFKNKSNELDNLVEIGASYLPKISCPFLLENLKIK